MKIIFVFGIFLLCGELFSQVRLYGDTNFPARSMYIPGEKIEIRLRAEGLRQGEQSELLVDVRDKEQTLKSYRLPVEGDAGGVWRCVLPDLPNREWGFYRVYARLSNGVALEKRGTRRRIPHLCNFPDPIPASPGRRGERIRVSYLLHLPVDRCTNGHALSSSNPGTI